MSEKREQRETRVIRETLLLAGCKFDPEITSDTKSLHQIYSEHGSGPVLSLWTFTKRLRHIGWDVTLADRRSNGRLVVVGIGHPRGTPIQQEILRIQTALMDRGYSFGPELESNTTELYAAYAEQEVSKGREPMHATRFTRRLRALGHGVSVGIRSGRGWKVWGIGRLE